MERIINIKLLTIPSGRFNDQFKKLKKDTVLQEAELPQQTNKVRRTTVAHDDYSIVLLKGVAFK